MAADLRFSTFNGGAGASPGSPGYTNRAYLTTERSHHYSGGRLDQPELVMSHDASYPDYRTGGGGGGGGGGVQYSTEYRTETRKVQSKKPAAEIHASIDLSSPFSIGGGGGSGVDVGYSVGYHAPKSPGAASSGSRHLLTSQAEQLSLGGGDAYANLPPLRQQQQQQQQQSSSTASGPLSPQQRQLAYEGGGGIGGFEYSVTTTTANAAGGRYGSASSLSGPRSPQYVNGGGAGYGYTVTTTETTRSKTRPPPPPPPPPVESLRASQSSGLDYAGRRQYQEQQQQQYVNYRELRDAPDGGGGAAVVSLSRSDKFGSQGSLSGGLNMRTEASLTLRSQGSASGGGGGGGGGYSLSVRDVELQEAPSTAMRTAAAASASASATATTVQESRQKTQRSVQQTRRVETSGATGGAEFRDPSMAELIAYLRSDSDATVLNAAAFIQHVTFEDNDAKVAFFRLGGLPPLVALLEASVGGGSVGARGTIGFDLLRNLLGIVRNITFRSNEDGLKPRDAVAENSLSLGLEELKVDLCRLGVLKHLREVVAASRDEEAREVACAAVWNISSSPSLKPAVIDDCAEALVATVLLPHSGLELRGEAYASVHQPMHATFLFYLASGVLRSVSSTPGEQSRNRLRQTEGLADCLVWPLLSAQAAQLEVNQPGLENCLCAVRNLDFACQEVADPGYLRRQQEAAAAAAAAGAKKSPASALACCGGKKSGGDQQQQKPAGQQQGKKKKDATPPSKSSGAAAAAPIIQRRMPNPIHGMDRLWYAADMAPLLQHLLDACARPQMLEAAAGAVQNLAACNWQPAVDFRRAFRSSRGHELLCQLVAEVPPELWPAVTTLATAYRNVLQDSEPGQVTAQQVIMLASALPPAPPSVAAGAGAGPGGKQPQPEPQPQTTIRRPADQQEAVIAALFAALRREPVVVADELFRCGAAASLVHICRNPAGNTPKVVSFAEALLAFLASSGDGVVYRNRLKEQFNWTGPQSKAAAKKTGNSAVSASASAGATSAKQTTTTTRTTTTSKVGGGAGAGAIDGGGIGLSVRGGAVGQENAAFQSNTMELRASASGEPQYAQISKGGDSRSYGYSTATTTKTTTVTQQQQQYQQEQQQQQKLDQPVADSWV